MKYNDYKNEATSVNSAIAYYAGMLNWNFSGEMRTEDFTYVVDFDFGNRMAKIVRVNKDYSDAKTMGFISTTSGECYKADDNGETMFNWGNDIKDGLTNDDLANGMASIARWDNLSF